MNMDKEQKLFRSILRCTSDTSVLEKTIAELDRPLRPDDMIHAITIGKNVNSVRVLLDHGCEMTHVVVSIAMGSGDLGILRLLEERGWDIRTGSMCYDVLHNPDTVRYYLENYPKTYRNIIGMVGPRAHASIPLATLFELYYFDPASGDFGRDDMKRILQIREKIATRTLYENTDCAYIKTKKFYREQLEGYKLLFGDSVV